MDNLSHTLAGLYVAEGFLAFGRRPPTRRFATRLRLTSMLANNFPDVDILYSRISGPKIGYLLHHRGFSHTVVFVVVAGALLAWILGKRFSLSEKKSIGWVSLIGLSLHITMDFLGSYGVHPFWPIDNHWYYGDLVFIIEPLFWLIWIPLLILGALQRFQKRRRINFILATSAMGLLLCLFGAERIRAKREVAQKLISQSPNGNVLDVVLSPFPANPFCWWFITVQADERTYTLRRGVVALSPVRHCPDLRRGQGRVPLEVTISRKELAIFKTNCLARALLKFARVPFVAEGNIIGDLRFDWGGKLGFAEFVLHGDDACPSAIPPWDPPRGDLF